MQEKFLTFMNSTAGRALRVIMGLALAAVGLLAIGNTAGAILALLAVIPVIGGLFDVCMAGMVLGYGLQGPEIREKLAQ